MPHPIDAPRRPAWAWAGALLLAGCAAPAPRPGVAALQAQVSAAERAFAKSMADRDLQAFASFVAEDSVFFSADRPLRGKAAVVADWKRFFDPPEAPFSWEPDQVAVLASGDLAHSSGPVRNPQGAVVSRFNSVWRLEAPGVWKVVFDRGEPVCAACPPK